MQLATWGAYKFKADAKVINNEKENKNGRKHTGSKF